MTSRRDSSGHGLARWRRDCNKQHCIHRLAVLPLAFAFAAVCRVVCNVAFVGVAPRALPSEASKRQTVRWADSTDARVAEGPVIVVAGATGRTGRLVVDELLKVGRAARVVALVRNATKAEEVLDVQDSRIQVVPWDAADVEGTASACKGAAAAIWCAEGRDGIAALGSAFCDSSDAIAELPQVVMCSSAAVTRPTWNDAKRELFAGVADIPIVRLNPNDILGDKRAAEDGLRKSGARYAIVRPTGLNDNWPAGRPVLSQGDLAVGRTPRSDLASLLVALLDEPEAVGKTFESVSVAGYPKPTEGYSKTLALLQKDGSRSIVDRFRQAMKKLIPGSGPTDAEMTAYGLLQQLLPGESQNAAGLAMGQTYEQYDRGEVGRLGPRGEEKVPERIVG